MRQTRRLLSLLATFGLACALAACNDAGQTEIARGNVLASRKQFDGALQAYRAAAQSQPRKARPRELLGHVLFDLNRYPEARQAYQDAVQVEPEGALEARIGLARIDAEDGKLDAALTSLGEVLQRTPNNLYALLSRANLALRRGQPADVEQAIVDTAHAMQIDKNNVSVLYTRGCAFIGAKEFDKASEAFGMLLSVAPASPLAFYGRARMASAQGDKAQVLAHLRQARASAGRSTDPGGAWSAAEVRADPAFRAFKDDAEFAAVVGN